MHTGNANRCKYQVHESLVKLHTLVYQPLIIKEGATPENETLTLNRYARFLLQAKLELANSSLQRRMHVGSMPMDIWQIKSMTGFYD